MLNFFKKELERAYRVLSTWDAELQNDRDIRSWLKLGYITTEEAKALHKMNLEWQGRHF